MTKFVNNWIQPIELTSLGTTATLSLLNGEYTLTIADSATAATRWEVVSAQVFNDGAAELARGGEGTTVQDWPAGSVIYCALTAGGLASILDRLQALEDAVFGAPPPQQL